MDNVYGTLVLITFVLLIVGIFSPKKSLFWDKQAPTRKKSALIYGGALFFSLFLLGNSVDPKKHPNTTSVTTNDKPVEEPTEKPLGEAEKKKMVAEAEARYKAQAAQEAKERAAQTMGARQLVDFYQENEVKADKELKGRTFYVTGTVSEIKKDITDNIYVTLEGDGIMREVQCYFDNEDIASDLKKGQQVTFKGKCDGLMMNVLMKDCTLVTD